MKPPSLDGHFRTQPKLMFFKEITETLPNNTPFLPRGASPGARLRMAEGLRKKAEYATGHRVLKHSRRARAGPTNPLSLFRCDGAKTASLSGRAFWGIETAEAVGSSGPLITNPAKQFGMVLLL